MNTEYVVIEDDDVEMYTVEINPDGFEVRPILSPFSLDKHTTQLKHELNSNGDALVVHKEIPQKASLILDSESEIMVLEDTPTDINNIENANAANHKQLNNEAISISETSFARTLRNNNLMHKIVKKCLSMKNCVGLPRVINKTLLPYYRDTHNSFKESDKLTKLLKTTLKALKYDPDHKFLHIKRLNEELKEGRLKKKVPFVTVATNLNIRRNNIIKPAEHKNKLKKKELPLLKTSGIIFNKNIIQCQPNTDIVNLDNSDQETVINLDDDDDDEGNRQVIVANDKGEETNNCDKENNNKTEQSIASVKPASNNVHLNVDSKSPRKRTNSDMNDELLIPTTKYCEVVIDNSARIKAIEMMIMRYNECITQLEEQEVTVDNENFSPYLKCAKLKEEVVKKYKELCMLTQSEVGLVKRRDIHLRVKEGHPPGPARELEIFLRNTKDESGVIPLPDFHDVLKQVELANQKDKLNWSKQRIMSEALTLFKECGQALRKQRQKREYKDLLSLVKEEQTDDPAERDPELQAKLEMNKIIGRAKENELFERFASMDGGPSLAFEIHSTHDNSDNSDSDNEDTLESSADRHLLLTNPTTLGDNSRTNVPPWPVVTIANGQIQMDNVNSQDQNTVTTFEQDLNNSSINTSERITDKESPIRSTSVVRDTRNDSPISTLDKSITNSNNLTLCNLENNVIDVEKDMIQLDSQNQNFDVEQQADLDRHSPSILPHPNQSDTQIKTDETNHVETPVEIKKEKIDWQDVLDNLGDNYTSIIFDIEDPFVAIEISSESSSDEL